MDFDTSYPVHLYLPESEFDLHPLFAFPFYCGEPHLSQDLTVIPAIPSNNNRKRRPGQETSPRLSKRRPMASQKPQSGFHRNQQQQEEQEQEEQQQQESRQATTPIPQEIATVNSIENDLHHLQDEWASIEIVLKSLRNAFSVRPLENAPEQLLDEVDRELSIAYDDLKAQVRHLVRGLQRLDSEIEPFRPRTLSEAKPLKSEPCSDDHLSSSSCSFSDLPRR